jgi:hypothetical protein
MVVVVSPHAAPNGCRLSLLQNSGLRLRLVRSWPRQVRHRTPDVRCGTARPMQSTNSIGRASLRTWRVGIAKLAFYNWLARESAVAFGVAAPCVPSCATAATPKSCMVHRAVRVRPPDDPLPLRTIMRDAGAKNKIGDCKCCRTFTVNSTSSVFPRMEPLGTRLHSPQIV